MTLVQDGQSTRASPAKLIARVALASLVFALAGCNGGTVDRHALKRDAEKVGSLATEGGLLANDVSRGASTKSFTRVHAQELSGALWARRTLGEAITTFRRGLLAEGNPLAFLFNGIGSVDLTLG